MRSRLSKASFLLPCSVLVAMSVCLVWLVFELLSLAQSEPDVKRKAGMVRLAFISGVLLIPVLLALCVVVWRRMRERVQKRTETKPTDTSSIWEEAGRRLTVNEDNCDDQWFEASED